ncbi:MAG: hypothetical protein A2Z34_01155 [Planctomycetes bacterium RBG_16_59_8]|nr:MAG: hypothetical protein A2Z34_01155 [Planctomycetes bacterium RBG_16_59_8]
MNETAKKIGSGGMKALLLAILAGVVVSFALSFPLSFIPDSLPLFYIAPRLAVAAGALAAGFIAQRRGWMSGGLSAFCFIVISLIFFGAIQFGGWDYFPRHRTSSVIESILDALKRAGLNNTETLLLGVLFGLIGQYLFLKKCRHSATRWERPKRILRLTYAVATGSILILLLPFLIPPYSFMFPILYSMGALALIYLAHRLIVHETSLAERTDLGWRPTRENEKDIRRPNESGVFFRIVFWSGPASLFLYIIPLLSPSHGADSGWTAMAYMYTGMGFLALIHLVAALLTIIGAIDRGIRRKPIGRALKLAMWYYGTAFIVTNSICHGNFRDIVEIITEMFTRFFR